MKKYVLLLLLFLISIIPSVVSAQDLAQSDSDASASSSLTYAPTYNSTGGDKRGLLGAYKVDPGYVAPLPAAYEKEGWKIWLPTPAMARGISMEKIEAMSVPCDSDVRAWADFGNDGQPIILLTYYPQGEKVDEMGYVIAYGKEKYPIESVIMEALRLAKKETGTNHATVFWRKKPRTVGKVRALGTAGVLGKAMGPAGETDQIVGAGAIGSGFGTATSYIDNDVIIKVVAFTSGGAPPPPIKKEVFSRAKNTEPHPQTVNLNISISGIDAKAEQQSATKPIIYAPSAIYFATNRYDIIGQEENLRQIADYLADIWNQVKAEGKLVWLRGSCDIRGREGYNDTLGMNRGETASIAIGRLMSERGIHPREIADTFRYASSGEHQLQFKNHDMNRRVDVIIGKTITQELPPPSYVR